MKNVFLSYAFNGKESDSIPSLKDELESHGIQIHDTNDFEKKGNNISSFQDSINTCDILIAFMIENYPNVAYDVGYAMSKDKKVLIVSDNSNDTSFYSEMGATILLRDRSETSCDILNFIDNC